MRTYSLTDSLPDFNMAPPEYDEPDFVDMADGDTELADCYADYYAYCEPWRINREWSPFKPMSLEEFTAQWFEEREETNMPNTVTIDAKEGFALTYKSDKPLKADTIAYLQVLFDILVVDLETFLDTGDNIYAA